MADSLINTQTVKGFRDYLPDAMMAREHLMETARRVYRSYGFSPIDTPALEYAEVLLAKAGKNQTSSCSVSCRGNGTSPCGLT